MPEGDMGWKRSLKLWDDHYDRDGPQKIAARKAVYGCVAPGTPEQFLLEDEVIRVIGELGVGPEATILDVGSSYPYFLIRLGQSGHTGRRIALDPNSAQFGDVSIWKPTDTVAEAMETAAEHGDDRVDYKTLYQLSRGDPDPQLNGIELIEGSAHFIPLGREEADVATVQLAMYHEEHLDRALQELWRTSKHAIITTRGVENKANMREDEFALTRSIGRIIGSNVLEFQPINSGFTSELARVVLPMYFDHVYERQQTARLAFEDLSTLTQLLDAHWTMREMYKTKEGVIPDPQQYEKALWEVFIDRIDAVMLGKLAMVDLKDESVFVCSKQELELPNYKKLATLSPELRDLLTEGGTE